MRRPSRGPRVWIARSCGRASAARRPGSSISGLVGSPSGRAIVVDDILDTGDTLVSCCRQLRDAGVRQIGVIATHGLFTGERWRALLSEGVQEIWITDTVLSRRRPPQAHIVPVAPLLAGCSKKTATEEVLMLETITRRFADRHAAGRELAKRLSSLATEDPVVLGLARGGVPVAYEVATGARRAAGRARGAQDRRAGEPGVRNRRDRRGRRARAQPGRRAPAAASASRSWRRRSRGRARRSMRACNATGPAGRRSR